MIPVDKVREIIKKHETLEKELSSGAIEKKQFASKSKEYSELNTVISHAKDYLIFDKTRDCLLYTSPSPRDATLSRMPSSA